jgi:hypothetical protein
VKKIRDDLRRRARESQRKQNQIFAEEVCPSFDQQCHHLGSMIPTSIMKRSFSSLRDSQSL